MEPFGTFFLLGNKLKWGNINFKNLFTVTTMGIIHTDFHQFILITITHKKFNLKQISENRWIFLFLDINLLI